MGLLKAEKLYKSFKSRSVVNGVSFQVKSQSVVGLLGSNGAGKTTSFYIVSGLIPPDQGFIEMNGQDISLWPIYKRAREGLSYLPQDSSIFKKLTVKENLWMAINARGVSGSWGKEVFSRLISEFHLESIVNSMGYALSGGERRKVEMARSLVGKPQFLLLDEPFAGVDPLAVLDIQGMIQKLRDQGIGILITDHNVRETLRICDFSYIISEGVVRAQGSPQEVADSDWARKFYLGEDFCL